MRSKMLAWWLIQREWRRVTGNDAAKIEWKHIPKESSIAVRFSIGVSSLSIAVPVEDMYKSINHFSEKFMQRVLELFREANVPGVCSRANLPVGSQGVVNGVQRPIGFELRRSTDA